MKKKCIKCGEVKTLSNFYMEGHRRRNECKVCKNIRSRKEKKKNCNTEIGFLGMRYTAIKARGKLIKLINYQCHFTFKEFCEAFEKHKQKYGMNSAWGPHHLPLTMIYKGRVGKKGLKNLGSNMSPDRLDSSKPYTLQNLIFIRSNENKRKNASSYEDCIAQMKLHEERFIKMKPY